LKKISQTLFGKGKPFALFLIISCKYAATLPKTRLFYKLAQ
jgi:hypothetical protein